MNIYNLESARYCPSYHGCGSQDKSDYGAKCLCQCVPCFVGHRVQGRQGQEVAKQRVNRGTCGKWRLNEDFIIDMHAFITYIWSS